MKIQVNYGDIRGNDTLTAHVTQAVEAALSRYADRVTRVEVHLHDDKQKRRGPDDKRCTMEARPAGGRPLAVEARSGDISAAASDCAEKLQRAVARDFERRQG
ncbi:MAG: ribosomal subunit interface protein [Phycisphaerales bacterium]|nr:HPF/RaiA family ribosome-associated protein [Phycisphaerae bacterium]NNF44954.1 ribosomal subunit interface protein [Phycisphaerales bacterium]NNM25983.1 ribosomal subunit interface protein [Phycisphaerales bacterium]